MKPPDKSTYFLQINAKYFIRVVGRVACARQRSVTLYSFYYNALDVL